jgi:hypothetical protein
LPPHPLVRTSGKDWLFQPHPDLYKILGKNVYEHYAHYKEGESQAHKRNDAISTFYQPADQVTMETYLNHTPNPNLNVPHV